MLMCQAVHSRVMMTSIRKFCVRTCFAALMNALTRVKLRPNASKNQKTKFFLKAIHVVMLFVDNITI